MAIQLFEHNQNAYEAAMSMLDREGMAAIIHPILLFDTDCLSKCD